jgi:aminoglycoside phosphotransferase (APT) family kinase protein
VYASVRVSDLSYHRSTRQPRALVETARWLGRFHAGHQNRVGEAGLGFLKRYDPEYYRGWARRTFDFAAPLQGRFPWLADLRLAGDAWFLPLLHGLTVIHGEFYAKTVLVRKEQLFMVDWESAAIAAGEIDLATLTEGKHWCGELTRQCEGEYRRARWPEGCPEDFDQRLDSARIYLHFRWLGDRPEWTTREKTLWRFDHLQAAAKRLGLL